MRDKAAHTFYLYFKKRSAFIAHGQIKQLMPASFCALVYPSNNHIPLFNLNSKKTFLIAIADM